MTPSWRREQRQQLLQRRMAAPPALRRQWSATITELLLRTFPVRAGTVVALYWPFKAEFDPRFAVRQWRVAGALAALPVVVHKHAALEFRVWWPGVATRAGVFDLPVPQGTDSVTPDVLLIPPVGFDAQCYRLGYGGGYYDRTLAALAARGLRPLKVGVGFELSRIDTIHPQEHDVALDVVVTETGVHRPGR